MTLDEYDRSVVDQIAANIATPGAVRRMLDLASKPMDLLLEASRSIPALRNVSDVVGTTVSNSLHKMVPVLGSMANEKAVFKAFSKISPTATHADIRRHPLKSKDQVATGFNMANALMLTAEGAITGAAATIAEGFPGAQFLIPAVVAFDVSASMTALVRQACQIATVYGYAAQDPDNTSHVLTAMMPREEGQRGGLHDLKGAFHRLGTKGLEELIMKVATRLGLALTEKQLVVLVPIAGAALNGSMNLAFQQDGFSAARDYFRRLCLAETYGADKVDGLIAARVAELRQP